MGGEIMRGFRAGLSGGKDEEAAARLLEAVKVRACERCGLRFGGGPGAFDQHLGDGDRGGTRCLPVHVFESVLTDVRGIWYARGTEPRT
jgi:hypothetical protein